MTSSYVIRLAGPLCALVVVDQTSPRRGSAAWRRLLWLAMELVLCFLVVRTQANMIRPALIYLLPAGRALLMFGSVQGFLLSLTVWVGYGLNIGLHVWPDILNASNFLFLLKTGIQLWPDLLSEWRNYVLFLLAPYVLTVLLTLAVLRQGDDRRAVQKLYEDLQAAHQELIDLHRQAQEATITQERNRLAREIHDTLAHYLTVINVQLEAAEKLGHDQLEQALVQVRRARRLALECLQEVRQSVSALRASTLEELALPKALEKLVRDFRENTGLNVVPSLSISPDQRFPPETALALYRVAQEGLTNVHKHSHATKVRLSLSRVNGSFELSVEDNGNGGVSDPPPASGFGLLGLKERVELLGGQLQFTRGSMGGSLLAVSVPAGQQGRIDSEYEDGQ
ncbi:MAG: sensor histidine kinase [Dehalococcoidia bacterium]|nr:sensor histidine kinase [Dehalococcoidia bacterium]